MMPAIRFVFFDCRQAIRIVACLALLALSPLNAGSRDQRVSLFPRLHAGQEITYLIRYHSEKKIKTTSNVIAPMAPEGDTTEIRELLRIKILQVEPAGEKAVVRARAEFRDFDIDVVLKSAPEKSSDKSPEKLKDEKDLHVAANEKALEFTILADGHVDDLKGASELTAEQQQAWREWAAQFALAATFPAQGVKRGDKWKWEDAEKSPAPIAGLGWLKDGTYVKDEACRAVEITAAGEVRDGEGDMCAEILTRARLKQNSSPKDTTPEEYKRHDLRTSGTARGTNEVITSISLRTGLVVRATQEANQSMDVQVGKADGSNGVHYLVDARSHSEIFLVTGKPSSRR